MSIEIQGVDKLINRLKDYGTTVELQTAQEVQATAYDVVNDMVRDAPVDTGNLRQGIVSEPTESNLTWALHSRADYSAFVEFDTAPHVIEATNAKVLTNGKSFFGKSINHPGTHAQPFFFNNVEMGKVTLLRRLVNVLNSVKK